MTGSLPFSSNLKVIVYIIPSLRANVLEMISETVQKSFGLGKTSFLVHLFPLFIKQHQIENHK
jgi:hypothetical protein